MEKTDKILTKYYGYGTGQSYVAIPVQIARELGLKHLCQLTIEIREIDSIQCIILTPIPPKEEDSEDIDP